LNDGDREFLGAALESFRPYLLMVANKELGSALRSKLGASDMVQETFCEAQRDWRGFQGRTPDELKAWLRRILINNLRDLNRKFSEDKRRLDLEVPLSRGRHSDLTAAELTPSTRAVQAEEALVLEAAMARLPEGYRRVIELRNHECLPFAEVGRTMGKTADAARMYWFRAVERLSLELAPNHGD
jgi:RNA polymerase sigma-70 factor (ECF subfamily)